MAKGGFLAELLAERKSTTGLEFVGNLIKYSIILLLVGIYWAAISSVFYFVYGLVFSGIQTVVPGVGIALTIALVLYFIYLVNFGLTVNRVLLGPVHYMLD
jgi:hypothetical protein